MDGRSRPEDDVPRRTRDVTALFDHARDVGPYIAFVASTLHRYPAPPDQDLETDFTRLPSLPKSRVVLANVRFAERDAPLPVSPVHLTVGGVSKV